MIGILGGMGPQAGVDLATNIIANTRAQKDQDHIRMVLLGDPLVPDRTEFLFGRTPTNPAHAMATSGKILLDAGATCIGVACNTAHSPPIFDLFEELLSEIRPNVKIVHLIQETVRGIQLHFPQSKRIGILATQGTYHFRLYDDPLEQAGLIPLRPRHDAELTDAIFHPEVGLKACSVPPTKEAREWVLRAAQDVIDQGADAVILGCTELPLAVPEAFALGTPMIDPGIMLARALISACAPDRLIPWRVATPSSI